MRAFLGLIAGAVAGYLGMTGLSWFARQGGNRAFDSWEVQVLPWVFGALVWVAIMNGGQRR